MSLGCASCGDCCEEIFVRDELAAFLRLLRADPNEILRVENMSETGQHNWSFLLENWRQVGDPVPGGQTRMACDQWDATTRLCMAHEDRPPVCSGFPWYGKPPGDLGDGVISKRCSYWLDVDPVKRPEGARPLIPLTVIQ